jgi:hypothetical protein
LGDLEDVIDDVLGERGETTGGGWGNRGGNVDVELYDDADWERTLGELVGPLIEEGVPLDAWFTLPDLPDAPRRTLLSLLPSGTG